MKTTLYVPVLIITVAVIVGVVIIARTKAVQPVTVFYYGTTNDSVGNAVHCFQVTNSMTRNTHGSYAVEVFHNGIWFNALPQPKGVDDLAYLPAKSAIVFAVPAPSGRAEQGLQTQPDPPGEKWRVYFSYTFSYTAPLGAVETIRERLRKVVGDKNGRLASYSFSPEMPFAPTSELRHWSRRLRHCWRLVSQPPVLRRSR